jgi:hypothetical protein
MMTFPPNPLQSLIAAFLLFLSTTAALAQSCSGSGCQYIQLQKRSSDECMVWRNTSQLPVEIRHGSVGTSFGTVYGGSEFVITSLGGGCMKNFTSNYRATVIGGPQETRPTPPSEPRQRPQTQTTQQREIRAPQQYRFYFDVQCKHGAQVAIHLLKPNGAWETESWWTRWVLAQSK